MLTLRWSNKLKSILYLATLLMLWVGILAEQIPRLNEFPNGQHAWAQSDHLALTEGFVENGLDIFHPQTYTYTKQFPHGWQHPHETRITPTNLPLHAYIPALIKKVFGISDPWPHRLVLLIVGLIGASFLVKLSWVKSNKHLLPPVLITIILLSSPLHIDYFTKYIPSNFSLSISFIAWYCYYLFWKKSSDKHLNWALILFFVACLNRLTFALPLSVVLLHSFIHILKGKKYSISTWLIVGVGLTLITIWTAYCKVLAGEHGSLFLSQILMPESWAQFNEHIQILNRNWLWHLFTPAAICLLIILLVIYWFTKSEKSNLKFPIIWYWVATFAFFFLMFRQFHAHDYYLLDTFFAPFLLTIIYCSSEICTNTTRKMTWVILALLPPFIYLSFSQSVPVLKLRKKIEVWDEIPRINHQFPQWEKQLNRADISKKKKLLILHSPAPNLPFIHLKRSGYLVHYHEEKNWQSAMNWPFDYMLLDYRNFFKEIYPKFPEIVQQIILSHNFDGFALGQKNNNPNRTLSSWFQGEQFISDTIIQEGSIESNRVETFFPSALARNTSFKIEAAHEFFWTIQSTCSTKSKGKFVRCSGKYTGDPKKAPLMVVHDLENKQRYDFDLKNHIETNSDFTFWFYIDFQSESKQGYKLYPWNIRNDQSTFDKLTIIEFEYKTVTNN